MWVVLKCRGRFDDILVVGGKGYLMDKRNKNDNQGTMRVVPLEISVLQTLTESSCAKENGVVITLKEMGSSGKNYVESLQFRADAVQFDSK